MHRDQLSAPVRDRLTRLPPPFNAHYGVVPLPPPEGGIDLRPVRREHDGAVAALATADALARAAGHHYLLSRVLARREAVSSSAMEGTHSTLDELLLIDEGAEPGSGAGRQVRAYAVLLERLLPEAVDSSVFTLDLLRRIHADIMRDDPNYKDEPGALRSVVNWIGGSGDISRSVFNPPPPDEVARCLAENVDYLRNEGLQQTSQSLVTRMAIWHAHFEAVHPFRDGNGRVGRLVLPLMMAAAGHVPLYLSPYIDANKAGYMNALKAAQQRLHWTPLIGYLCEAVVAVVDEAIVSLRAMDALRRDWLGRRAFRSGSASLRTLDLLPNYPVLTAKRLAEHLGVSAPQAQEAVRQLQAAGILKEKTGYRRNRIFTAHEVLSILNRPFGEPIAGDVPE